MTSLAIKAEHLAKRYKVAVGRQHNTLREHLSDKFKSLLRRGRRSPTAGSPDPKTFWALIDVSIDIKEGETVGLIGRNGAGKSTLLKIFSRITEPTGGRARVCGRIGSLLEVGTGFHHELSGRENLYLSGAILGMKKAEIDRKFDAIVAFAEIEKFIETPVKHYSSGMYVRLAFAVAAHLEPDILLIDEVLSVGDLAFQTKCIDHAKRLQSSGATVLFVSHNMFSIKSMCNRVIYLSGGRVRFDGKFRPLKCSFTRRPRASPLICDAPGTNGPVSPGRPCVVSAAIVPSPKRTNDPTDAVCDGHSSVGVQPSSVADEEVKSSENVRTHGAPVGEGTAGGSSAPNPRCVKRTSRPATAMASNAPRRDLPFNGYGLSMISCTSLLPDFAT
jgi:ABC-type polysaccharide/polyol phosphate transport system ATPase subunit